MRENEVEGILSFYMKAKLVVTLVLNCEEDFYRRTFWKISEDYYQGS